jgi:hypothetical protein
MIESVKSFPTRAKSARSLYHAKKLPYAVKVGTRRMFSRNGIQRFIAKQAKG